MQYGMLWYDRDAIPLNEKIRRAAEYYRKKYGEYPSQCFASPSEFENGIKSRGFKLETIRVRPSGIVTQHHLFLGDEGLPSHDI